MAQQLKDAATAARIPVGNDGHVRGGTPCDADAADEDEARRYWLLVLEQAVLHATARVASLQQEAALLRHRATLPKGQAPPPVHAPPELLQQLHAAASALQGRACASVECGGCLYAQCGGCLYAQYSSVVLRQGASGSAWLRVCFNRRTSCRP